ncbi:MAG: choice-of-anchor L domain-containing protein [Bacteroidota bacterium]
MKKITLLFFMTLISFCSYAQYPEGFEGTWTTQTGSGAGGPAGWAIVNQTGPINTWIQGNGTTQQPAHTGTHGAYMNSENVAGGTFATDWLITPATLVPTNGQIRFWSHLFVNNDQGSTYKIMVSTVTTAGTVAEQTNTANFTNTVVQWTELTINPVQNDWVEKIVSLSAFAGQTVYIAFVMDTDAGDRWAIDDVNVVSQCLDPTALTASSQGLTTATLSWTNPGNATLFDLEIVTGSPTGTPTATSTTATYNATGLTQNTDYKYYVRANCGNGNYSNWVGPFNFSTVALGESCTAPIVIGALPYSTTDTTANYGDNNYDGSPGATGCGVNYGYLNGNDVVYSYAATQTGVVSIDLTGLTDNYAGMFVYNSCANIGVSCIGGDYNNFETTPLSIPTLSVTAGVTYYIVISTYASPQTVGYTLTVQQVNCAPPVGLLTTSIGMTSANLSWTNPSGATSWEVVVQPVIDGIPTGSGVTANTNTNWAATGLTSSTAYEYYVRANCGNGTFSAWAGPYVFNTMICEVAEQCTYTIVMTDSYGDGWNGNTMTLSQNGINLATVTLASGSGPQSVTVPVCDDTPVQLYWNAGGSYATEVGVSLQNNFSQTFYTKPSGTGLQNSVLYTGNVDCDNIMCLAPTNLTVPTTTTTSASIGWAGQATGNWNYYIVPQGGAAPGAGAGINTTTNPTNVTGLTIGTNYQFYVQMVCDNGTSEWAGPYSFSTQVCEAVDQCDYTFIMTSSWWVGYAGATMVISQNGTTVATIGSTFTTGQTQTVTVPLCTETPFQVFWANAGTSSSQVGLEIINGFDQSLFEMLPFEGTPGTVLFTSTADCDTPACLAPEELYAGDYTTTTAQLGWAGPATGNWEYFVVAAGGTAPTAASTPTGTATTNPVTVTGLTTATNYDFYVRLVCEEGSSEWSVVQPFHTAVCEEENQCTYIFRLTDADTWGDGWSGGGEMIVYQAGVPVAVLGADFTSGQVMDVEVGMCPGEEFELVWTSGGWSPGSMGIIILTPFAEDVYTKLPGEGTLGTTLYTGTGNCTPPACPKPQQLVVSDLQLTSADFEWTEMGAATSWEVIVLPYGSAAPAEGAAVDPANVVTATPLVLDGLTPGTTYSVYVRAICGGEDGNSTWSGPATFTTAIANDECDGAVNVPVNPDGQCLESVMGTVTGATGSGVQSTCSWMAPEYDVWFSFEPTSTTQTINIGEQEGAYYNFAVYEGDCGELTEVYCGYNSYTTLSDLTIGGTYYIQVYTTYLYGGLTSFEVCVATPEPPIAVSATEYTVEELVTDVLIDSECAIVSNITSSSGANFASSTSIGYFTQNGSSFPFEDGVILSTGGITEAPGPWPGTATFDSYTWGGDADLSTILADNGNNGTLYNATVLEFDFVPLTNSISFDFLFASSEYGTFQCNFSDAFAFILSGGDMAPGTYANLAVIPETNIPVSVVNIRDSAYNANCDSQNVEYFDQYNPSNPAASSIGYNGQTVVMQAVGEVTPGQVYHIKLVIADYNDASVNSAVFIEGGSFSIGDVDLGLPMLIADGNAACDGEEVVLTASNIDLDDYDITWFKDGELQEGENGLTFTVTGPGTYTIHAEFVNTDCAVEGETVIEYFPAIEVITGDPLDLTVCDADGFAEFNLAVNTPVLLGTLVPAQYTVQYFATQADALSGTATPLPLTYTNTTQYQQTIWVRVQNIPTECFGVKSFDLIVQDLTPQFTITDDFSICEGTSGTITVTPGNYNPADVTYTWTKNDAPFAGTTGSVTVTEAGIYVVTINNSGCTATGTVTVSVTPTPVAQEVDDVTSCDSYTLEALTAGNSYFTQTNGGGTELFAGDILSETQNVYVLAQSGTTPSCTAESVFTVTIVASPVIVDAEVANVTACDSYTLPALTVGAYFDADGVAIPVGTEIETTATITVNAVSGDCSDTATFTVTVTPTPVVADFANVAVCDIYNLEALPAGNAYYTGPGGTGQQLAVGAAIIDDQTIYVYAVAAGNADCSAESSFDVVIIPTPEILVTEMCNDDNQYELGVDFLDEIYNEDFVTYSWTNAAGAVVGTNPTLILSGENGQPALGEGVYHVEVTPVGEVDCPIYGELDVISIMCSLPRGISPNGDGKNDSFDLTTLDVKKLSVFNRYGKEVYSFSGNYTNQFAGLASNGHELPSGTYFYMVERTNGETLTGWVYVNFEN